MITLELDPLEVEALRDVIAVIYEDERLLQIVAERKSLGWCLARVSSKLNRVAEQAGRNA